MLRFLLTEDFLRNRYCKKTIIVIHEEIVKQLEINEETWVEQEVTDNGILLRITAFLKK